MKFLRIACAFLIAVSSPAWAACSVNFCPNTVVQRLWVNTNGKVYVKISDSLTPLNCTPGASDTLVLLRSDTNSDWIYAALLTAITSNGGKLENIRISEGSGECYISYIWQKPQ